MATIYFIRHAQSFRSDDVHFSEWPLSDTGHAQAHSLATVLAELDLQHLYCSPFTRCRQTIAPFVEKHDFNVVVREDLRERHIANGFMDDFWDVWHRSWDDFHFALPGTETSHQCQQRIHAAMTEIASGHVGETVGISSHGYAIALFLNKIDPGFEREAADQLRNPDIVKVSFNNGEFRLDEKFAHDHLEEIATNQHETPHVVKSR